MLKDNERAVLQFSGGKDSAALLHLAKPHLDRIVVYFADSGAVYPHVREFVHTECERLGAKLEVIRPPVTIEDWQEAEGLPSDIVPVESTAERQWSLTEKAPQRLQPYTRCCTAMLWLPMAKAIKASGIKTVLRGSKRCDARVGVPDGHVDADGIVYRSPLWDWSDGDVYAYLAKEGVTLPTHYAAVPDSLDCWLCTGHLKHHGAAKLRWTKEHHPNLWPELSRRVAAVRNVIDGERAKLSAALDLVES
jgi:3'-phosphoadenosine 5'-phosphosulfate sulfotransferase (PAPS reductase)/FAD synthetase